MDASDAALSGEFLRHGEQTEEAQTHARQTSPPDQHGAASKPASHGGGGRGGRSRGYLHSIRETSVGPRGAAARKEEQEAFSFFSLQEL